MDYNVLMPEVAAANERWWRDLDTGEIRHRNMGETVMLIISEIAEAMEGERKGLMDDKLPHRKMAEIELADVVIRVLDLIGHLGGTFELYKEKPFVPPNKGEALLNMCNLAIRINPMGAGTFTNHMTGRQIITSTYFAGLLLLHVEAYCEKHGYNLRRAIDEKMAYNLNRPDHKPENRKQEHGKKW